MSSFTTRLIVTPLADGKRWRLAVPFEYHVGAEESGDVITVPRGFTTDFASVPRPFWSLFPPWGTYGKAAVLHDYLYVIQGVRGSTEQLFHRTRSRAECDGIFLEAMKVLGVNIVTRTALWSAVRTWGWIAWRKRKPK